MKYLYKVIFSTILFYFFFVGVDAKEVVENVLVNKKGNFYFDFIMNDDGDFIAVGANGFVFNEYTASGGGIAKLNGSGEVLWEYTIENLFTFFYKVERLSNGNYVAIGDYSDPPYGIFVIFNDDGEILLEKKMSNDTYSSSSFKNFLVTDDGFVVVGSKWEVDGELYSTTDRDYIIKFDNDGNVLWELHDQSLEGWDDFNNIIEKENGNYIVVGGYYDSSIYKYSGIVLEYDKGGNIVNYNDQSFSSSGVFLDVISNGNNEYILVSCDDYNTYFYYIDENLSYVDKVVLKLKDFSNIEKYKDGYLITSIMSSKAEEIDDYREDVRLAYYDSDFNFVDYKIFDANYYNRIDKIRVVDDRIFFSVVDAYTIWTLIAAANEVNYKFIEYKSIFTITEEETSNGTYEVSREEDKGIVRVKPEEGYVLSVIQIFDSNGDEVPYYEEDGIYYFDLVDDVKINVEYKKNVVEEDIPDLPEEPKEEVDNPDTKDFFNIGVLILLGLSFILSVFFFHKKVQLK